MRRRSAANEAPPSLSMFRRVAPPWSESLLRRTATAASAGKRRGKAERRKEAGSSRRKNCPEQAFAENRRARDRKPPDANHQEQHLSQTGKAKRVFVSRVLLAGRVLG